MADELKPYLDRKEAILAGEAVTPMTRKEAILAGEDIPVFTRKEKLLRDKMACGSGDEDDEGAFA